MMIFFKRYKFHKEAGLNAYHVKSFTRGNLDKMNYHSKNASNYVVELLERQIMKRCGLLYAKYLERYKGK